MTSSQPVSINGAQRILIDRAAHLIGDVDDGCGCDVFASVNSSVQPDVPLVLVLDRRTDATQLYVTYTADISHADAQPERPDSQKNLTTNLG